MTLNEGDQLVIRTNIPQEDWICVGVLESHASGQTCVIRAISPVRDGYRNVEGPCKALHVEILSGPRVGARWWIPASWAARPCMFKDMP